MDLTTQSKTAIAELCDTMATSIDAFILVDNDGCIIETNACYCRLTGYTRDELLQLRISDIELAGNRGDQEKRDAESAPAETLRFETRYRHKDGSIMDVEVSAKYSPLQGGCYFAFVRQISSRKQLEQRLRESEGKFRAMVNAFDGLLYICSADLRITYMNAQIIERAGREAIGELCHKVLHDLDLPCSWCVLHRVLAGETVKNLVQSPRDGRWFEVTHSPIRNSDGSMSKQSMFTDVTERKRLEDNLVQSEERYRVLVENSPAPVLLHRDGAFIYVNQAACRLLGAENPDQLVGTPIMGIVPPEYRDLVRRRVETVSDGQVNQCIEQRVLRLDGTEIDVEVVGTSFSYQGQKTVQVIMLDNSARKQAQQALVESEGTLKFLMDAMPVGVALLGIDGRIEYVNHCFEQKFGYRRAEAQSFLQWCSLVLPAEQEREKFLGDLESAFAESLEYGAPLSPFEAEVTCRDGKARHMVFNVHASGERRILIFTDISDREALQKELLKAQKLESLGVLAGGIAHDFNNILTGILGNISFARIFLDETHKANVPLENAEKASLRAAGLATQLLTFAKGGTPQKKTVSIGALVKELVSLALLGTQVKAELLVPETLHAVEADEGQINQSLHNLVLNAVEAMPKGGTLTVSGENIVLKPGNPEGLPAGPYVVLHFADAGSGIPAEIQARIFDPYFTTKSRGSGLGLASVHSIITRHGGRIKVSSAPGQGAVFTILLPASGETAPAPEGTPEAAVAAAGDRKSILVMDDEPLVLNLARQFLEHFGYRVTTCVNGEQAVEFFRDAQAAGSPFAAVIVDLTVPGAMGGAEAARHILELDPAARLIVSSGYSGDQVMAQYQRYGFCAAIAKPYRGRDLASVLSGQGI